MAYHFRRFLRPMMLTPPNECGQGDGNDAAGEGGLRGNGAINRGALHQGPNHPEVFFSALALVHQNNFVIQSFGAGKEKFWSSRAKVEGSQGATFKFARRDPSTALGMTEEESSPYNGDGTFIRKITIIMSPMKSFAITPARPPRNVPQPARPAFMTSFPPISSPAIAPITGPTKSPNKPKNSPRSAPAAPPIRPHLVAPKRFAPKYPAAASIA